MLFNFTCVILSLRLVPLILRYFFFCVCSFICTFLSSLPPLFPIVLYSFLLYFLFYKLTYVFYAFFLIHILLSCFLSTLLPCHFPLTYFIHSTCFCIFRFSIVFSSLCFVASFPSDDFYLLFFSSVCVFPSCSCLFLSVFAFHTTSLTVSVTNATHYWIIYCNTFFCLPVIAHVYRRSSRHGKRAGRVAIWKMILCDRISLLHSDLS